MALRKVQKKKVKLKVGLSGASGFGKTYSALLLAYGMVEDWDKIAVIDTENGSADLYQDLGEYNVLPLAPPFSPERYIAAINECVEAGMECIIIDSITHEWSGTGGCLDIHASLGGQFQAWAKVTPRHQAFIDAILQSPVHVITTVRRKQDHEMVNTGGKVVVQKRGTKEITREGFEYELTLNFEFLNENHLVKASKDRTKIFDSRPEFIITPETGKELMAWANTGVDEIYEMEKEFKVAATIEDVKAIAKKYSHLKGNPKYMKAGGDAQAKFTTKAKAS